MADDPFALFDTWYAEAKAAEVNDPDAMALATSDLLNEPSVRMVLLKGHGPDGFVFYTNEQSRKAREMSETGTAALLFHWKSLRRQVRIEGFVERVYSDEADSYFSTRSRDSQLGAWASDQSSPLESREHFEHRFDEIKAQFEGRDVPRPPHWGGFRVVPNTIEFWSDRPHRLHERRQFFLTQGGWDERLLYP